MAYAYTIYSAGSSQTDYTISFPYIKEAHVKVYVNYVDTSFTFHNATTARLASAPASGTRVEVRRVTPPAAVLVDYADGSTLTASDLDTSNLQHLYIAQELDDSLKQGISISSSTGLPTLGSQKLTEVSDPTAAQDAATKNYVDTTTQPVDAELTELATMSSGTASSLADLTNTEVQILDGATVTTTELNLLDGVTATTAEINYVDGVTSNVQTQLDARQPLDAELTELATMSSDTAAALADLTQAEAQILDGATLSTAELNFVDGVTSALQTQLDAKQPLDADLTNLAGCQAGASANIALLTSGEVAILDGATLSTAELNTLSGLNSSTAELNKLDGVTATTTNLNVVSGMTKATTLTSNSDTEFPTSKAVNDRILTVTNALGGFVAISNETSFPATNPDPSDGAGTVVSISDAGGVVVNGSGVATIANGAGTGNTVTINGFPSSLQSKTLGTGIGLQVQTTTTLHTYTYHKVLAKEADVERLSDDINDFNNRYRTATGSNPSSDNDAGDLFFSQDTDKMYVRNAANNAWDEVVSVGEFFINTLSSLGSGSDNPPGGSATFNGTARKFTLSNPPSVAQQLIVSINGVIQKPNSGSGFPSEGFSLNGSALQLAAAPATGAPFFIITIGSTVNIGTPSAGTIDLAKLNTSNTGSTGQYLKKDGSTEGIGWSDVTMVGGNNAVQFNDNVSVKLGDGTYGEMIIFSDGTQGVLRSGTASGQIHIQNNGTSIETMAKFIGDGAVELNHNNVKKFETTSAGIDVTGRVTADDLTVENTSGNLSAYFTATNGLGSLEIGGSTGAFIDLKTPASDDFDLRIGADGTLTSGGNINFTVQGNETGARFLANGACELYHDNVKKLETSAAGATVTGNLIPEANNTRDLGSSSNGWANIYTNDLNLSNEGSSNDVDGTWGSYTIQEGAEELFLINKRNGKKYKFNLTEVS